MGFQELLQILGGELSLVDGELLIELLVGDNLAVVLEVFSNPER